MPNKDGNTFVAAMGMKRMGKMLGGQIADMIEAVTTHGWDGNWFLRAYDYYGKDAFKPGEAKNSWLTGTAAWNWAAISQDILGIKPGYDGLWIDPCVPKGWKGYRVVRKFRGATYNITIENPMAICKGVPQMRVDGIEMDGNVIPVAEAGRSVDVLVTLG